MSDKIQAGLRGEASTVVSPANTANTMASGIPEVYASPMMIALMEGAAADSVAPLLDEGLTTVGILVNVKHLAATPLGHTVRAESELLEVDGKRLVFKVEAYDEMEKIGEGTHERFIVETNRFMGRVLKKVKA